MGLDRHSVLRVKIGMAWREARPARPRGGDAGVGVLSVLYCKGLKWSFESTSDLEKPMFVAQMGWRRAAEAQEREEQAERRVAALEDRVRRLVADGDVARRAVARERRRQELARARNRRNPKHVRKRIRQAKKRKKKGK